MVRTHRLFPKTQRQTKAEMRKIKKEKTRTSDSGCISAIPPCGRFRLKRYPRQRRICAFTSGSTI
ncbi:hypothetical protein FS749_008900, partial [Ceratobasidium sp. UAMH 11750]